MTDIHILIIDDQYGSSEPFRRGFLEKVGAITKDGSPTAGYPYQFTFHSGQENNKANSAAAVTGQIRQRWPSEDGTRWALILLDVCFDQIPKKQSDETFGFELLEHLRSTYGANLPVVMLTSEDESKRRKANIAAADGFLPKNNLSRQTLDISVLSHGLIGDTRNSQYRLIGHSLALLKTLRDARRYAINPLGSRIIYGETGAGKTELARYIHDFSSRPGEFRPWTVEKSEDPAITKDKLFGHWKGAHSGAKSSQAGEIELANNGTFLLDEVAYLPQEVQQLLIEFRRRDPEDGLRTLTRMGIFPTETRDAAAARGTVNGRLQPNHKIKVDILFLSATNQDIRNDKLRESFGFRKDLLNDLGLPIIFPSLNERQEDIPDIFSWMVSCLTSRNVTISHDVMELLKTLDWKDRNVVYLKSIAEAAVSNLGDFDEILLHKLPMDIRNVERLSAGNIKKPEIDARGQESTGYELMEVSLRPKEVEYRIAALTDQLARTVSLEKLPDILRSLDIPADRMKLTGIMKTIDETYTVFLKRLIGAALKATQSNNGRLNYSAAMFRLLGIERAQKESNFAELNTEERAKRKREIDNENAAKVMKAKRKLAEILGKNNPSQNDLAALVKEYEDYSNSKLDD